MKLKLDIDPDLVAMMAAEIRAGEKAVSAAMREAGTGLKSDWRAQITGAGLGRRLANSIRLATYPKAGNSLNAAALVWSKAPVIIGAHDTGPLIRSKDGFWLAIPTPAAGKSTRGEVEARNAALMKEWEVKNGAYLRAARKQRGAIPEKEAYTAAMKALQDRYYEQVGRLCGLLRDGPRKERLSTVQYGKRKQSARQLENDLDQAATARDQAEETADHALDIKEEYQLRAKALAAEKAEFDEGVAAMEELADQLNEGSAKVSKDQIEMTNPPTFLKRLFGSRSPETKTSSLFRKLVTAIGRIAQTGSPAEELEK